ncbi:nitroreductase family protein [Carboxylicivirga taeanensis]|uniref:nitroreductase family protein n=1 Tax=Carboxylicivirga taeanensis TaxID=1416875 RepID=UPI003F6DF3FF
MLKDLILKNRSYRRFYQNEPVELDTLRELVDLARLSPSARNAQPLKYFISNSSDLNDKIFPHLSWAGYFKDWPGPEKGEQPAAYIVVLNDTDISSNYFCDDGIATQSILLGAVEKGLGGCIIGSLNRLQLQRVLRLSDNLKIVHIIAIGKPKEEVHIEQVQEGNIKYWRDVQQVHHVPKRDLKDIIV